MSMSPSSIIHDYWRTFGRSRWGLAISSAILAMFDQPGRCGERHSSPGRSPLHGQSKMERNGLQ
jgi:hypothetical protein